MGDSTAQEPEPAGTVRTTRALLVWSVAMLGYTLAVLQRTSLGVAGLEAAERYSISAATLSASVFLQVTVYIAVQLPGGLLVDRWGPRSVLAVAGALLAAGQLLLAVAPTLGVVVLARALVGAGDGVVLVAVLALVPRWFPAARVPLVTQLTAILSQTGQILSAVPFVALLSALGWSFAFGLAAAASAVAALMALVVVRNAPGGTWAPASAVSMREAGRSVRDVWRRPGTRLGFFGHMGTQFSMMTFSLLWGMPYLVSAQGLSSAAAGNLIAVLVGCTIVIGPVLGVLSARHPLRRSWLMLGVIAADLVVWTAVLAVPGPAPYWLLLVLVMVLAAGGPGSVVGFDIARTSNPGGALGLAQSVVNLGGFLATLLVLAAMGVLLELFGGFGPDAFRVAWLVQYPVWLLATVGLLVSRRQARRLDAGRGVVPRPLREVVLSARR